MMILGDRKDNNHQVTSSEFEINENYPF